MALGLVAALAGAGASIYGANKASKAAKDAANMQAAGIERGINETEGLYREGQGYLAPYVEGGAIYGQLLDDIIGVNGPEAQAAALQMYRNSPSATLLNDARAETIRRTDNQFAASGGANSGARLTELGRRTADLDLANYHQWQNLPMGMFNTGANAAGAAASLAGQRSGHVLGARTGQGTALASGTIGSANAQLAGLNAGTNYLQNLLGRASTMDLSGSGRSSSPYYTQSQMNQLNGYF